MKTVSIYKNNSIQLLRAIAVLLVVYVHIIDSSKKFSSSQWDFFYLENWGAIGLDLFFVISGFIMTIIAPRYIATKNWKDFAFRRILRIVPLYWVLSFFSLGYSVFNGSPVSFDRLIKTILFFPIFDSRFVFPLIPVGWSLSLEMYFYLIIAILLIFFNKSIYKYLIGILVSLSIAGAVFNPENQLLKFLTTPLLIEFALGILAGMTFKHVCSVSRGGNNTSLKIWAISTTATGASLMLLSIFSGYFDVADAALVSENNRLAFLRSVIWGIPSALFLTGFVILENLAGIKINSFFTQLGDASYSCYLAHTTLFIPVSMKLFQLAGGSNGDACILFCLLFVSTGSLIFYKWVETPLNLTINEKLLKAGKVFRLPVLKKSSNPVKRVPVRIKRA
jgi:exopolysaccharide production protein ExoZ